MKQSTKFFLYTFGCRCNQADSAAIRAGLCRDSMEETRRPVDADLVVVNTCTVTHRADQQARQMIRRLRRENPGARIVVTGCYAERDPQALAAIPGVDLVVGNAGRDGLPEIVQEGARRAQEAVIHSPFGTDRDFALPPMSQIGGKTRPFIKLQDGCDARCSYCIVPSVRGPGRSARPEDVLAEIRSLVESGYHEIVLVGVHLGTYGLKLEPRLTLLELLRRIVVIPGLGRLRLGSIEPMRFARGIVRLARENPVFAHHFHIPLQSGSDRILRRMRRPYTAARFRDLVGHIRDTLPDAALGTDVLVGFPGESDEDFEQTLDVINRSGLSYLHVFPFSARQGTDAAAMRERVPPDVALERARIVREISQARNLEFRRRFSGKVLPAITLAKEEGAGESVALTANYIHARIPNCGLPPNRLIDIRIDEVHPGSTWAMPMIADCGW